MEEAGRRREVRIVRPFDPSVLQGLALQFRKEFLENIAELGSVPSEFDEIKAKLCYHVNWQVALGVDAKGLKELSTLFPELAERNLDPLPIVPACDLIDAVAEINSKLPLEPDSVHLQSLSAQIDRLYRIRENLREDKTCYERLGNLIRYYEEFKKQLCEEGADIDALLSPRPTVCGIDVSYSELPYKKALKIQCRNENGEVVRDNHHGMHATTIDGKLFFKPKMPGHRLDNGEANAVGYAYQILNRRLRVATPDTLLIVRHVWCKNKKPNETLADFLVHYNRRPCMDAMVQVTALSEGVLFDEVLQLQRAFKQWIKLYPNELLGLLDDLANPEVLEMLVENSGLEKGKKKEIPQYLEKLPKLVGEGGHQKAVEVLPNITKRMDGYSLCALDFAVEWVVGRDIKAANLMFRDFMDQVLKERRSYLEGLDIDLAFYPPILKKGNGHVITLRSITYFINLDDPVDPDWRREMLEFPAIYLMLCWLYLANGDDRRFRERVNQGVFAKKELFEDQKAALDRPLKFHEETFPRMLKTLLKAQELLKSKESLTRAEFKEGLNPIVFKVMLYLLNKNNGEYLAAYHELCANRTIEEFYEEMGEEVPNLDEYSLTEEEVSKKSFDFEGSIADLLVKYRYNDEAEEQCRFLEFVGKIFPFVKKLRYKPAEINELLSASSDYMLPNAIDLLLRCHADPNVDIEEGKTVLHKILAFQDLEKVPEAERILIALISHKKTKVDQVDSDHYTPLMVFISCAKNYSHDFICRVVDRLLERGVDINQRTEVGTVMDVAVKIKSAALLSILVSRGARDFKNEQRCIDWIREEGSSKALFKIMKALSVLNPNFQFERAMALCSRKSEDESFCVKLEGNYGAVYYFYRDSAGQLHERQGLVWEGAGGIENHSGKKTLLYDGEALFYAIREGSWPDTEIAVSRLHQAFNSYTAPRSEVFGCQDKEKKSHKLYLMSVSEGVRLSEVLDDDSLKEKVFSQLDRANITKLVFIQALLRQSAKTDHIWVSLCQLEGRSRYIFSCAFTGGAISPAEQERQDKRDGVFDYLRPLAEVPMAPQAIEDLLSCCAEEVFSQWLDDLFLHECRVGSLSSHTNRNRSRVARNANFKPIIAPIRSGDIKKYFERFEILQGILRGIKSPQYSVGDFLNAAERLLMEKYTPNLELVLSSSPQKTQSPVIKKLSSRMRSGKTLRQKGVNVLEALSEQASGENPLPNLMSITAAKLELKGILEDGKKLSKVGNDLKSGDLRSFRALPPHLKNKALASIDWEELGKQAGQVQTVLSRLSEGSVKYTEFVMKNCTGLHTASLRPFLQGSFGLRLLNLEGSSSLTDNLMTLLSNSCGGVAEINLDRTNIRELEEASLPYLTSLSAGSCPNLKKAHLNAPNLLELNFSSSVKLSFLKFYAKAPALRSVNINSTRLDGVSLRELQAVSMSLTDFYHKDLPPFNMRAFCLSLSQRGIDSPEILKGLVQDNLFNLYGLSLQENYLGRVIAKLIGGRSSVLYDKGQVFDKIDLRGCSFTLRFVASLIEKAMGLGLIIFQTDISPKNEKPQRIKKNQAMSRRDLTSRKGSIIKLPPSLEHAMFIKDEPSVKKIVALQDGRFVFFYTDANYECWDLENEVGFSLKNAGNLGKKLSDAELLPNGDLLICCDEKAVVLDTLRWKTVERLEDQLDRAQIATSVRVIGTRWLAVGGCHLRLFEITARGFELRRTFPWVHVKALALTSDQRTLLVQTQDKGILVLKAEDRVSMSEVKEEYVAEDLAASIEGFIVIDNFTLMIFGSKLKKDMLLNLETKALSASKLSLGVSFSLRAPGGDLLLGSPESKDFIVYNHRTKKIRFPFKEVLDRIFSETTGLMGPPCFTSQGDLLVSVGKNVWLIRNHFMQLSLSFADALPLGLAITYQPTQDAGVQIRIAYPNQVTPVEAAAIKGLTSFIKQFFPSEVFGINDGNATIIISNIPLEDLNTYKMMLESFLQQSKVYQQKFSASQQLKISMLQTSNLKTFFSSQEFPRSDSTSPHSPSSSGPSLTFSSDDGEN